MGKCNLSNFGAAASAFFVAGAAIVSDLSACTGIELKPKDGSHIDGRTCEFGVILDLSVALVPRGYEFKGTTPKGPGLAYKAKYAATGVIAFGDPAIMDGINEKGLTGGIFYFPGYAGYTETTSENQSKSVSPIEFFNWILTQFATVDEVKNALGNIVIAPTVNKDWGPTPPPFHYIVYDKSGKSLVIEPINGKLVTYDNPIGTFTNSPTFDWQLTNLRNYVHISPENAKPVTISGLTLAPFGQGSGLLGIPGDFTPPSRFVRAAYYSTSAEQGKNADEAVYQAFHILDQFDIPKGIVRQNENGKLETDYTLATTVKEPQSLKYYFKTYNNQTIQVVDLNQLDLNGKNIKKMPLTGSTVPENASSKLK